MILFIDDDPHGVQKYVHSLESRNMPVHLLRSVTDVENYVVECDSAPACIILDVMFPADPRLPGSLTDRGMTTGMPLFASLRARFPSVHILVLTNSTNLTVNDFFRRQDNCSFYYKTEMLPEQLASVVNGIVTDHGSSLLDRLRACTPGRKHARAFEALCVDLLEYLFVPPLTRVVSQSARLHGHDIRDAVLPNSAAGFFWESIRRELDAKHLVAEFKNLVGPIGKDEVIQLRQYLSRKSLGRFGILISRLPASESALTARADAYAEHDILILFVDDDTIERLIAARREGRDPSLILQEMKETFEIAY